MKKFSFFFFLFFSVCTFSGYAQFTRYVIQLTDKAGTPYSINNPSAFLTQRAIDRRARYSIPVDSTDLPVNPRYIDSIRLSGNVSILNVSKWFNQVCIQTSDATALNKINSFPFVINTAAVGTSSPVNDTTVNKKNNPKTPADTLKPYPARPQNALDFYSYGQSYDQINLHNGEFLHDHGFHGEGMILTITDDGFYHYQELPTFDSVNINNQVLGTWDFVTNLQSVNEDDAHGMNCFSTIAANMPGIFMGSAPKTSFYLFRTEDAATENPIEMHNWIAAAEEADSLGDDVISVSLGYTVFDNNILSYTYSDMNGNTTVIAKGVNMAARKGILVVAAAGNDGQDDWHYIETPGDADSALTVGAVNAIGQVAPFSSYGPNSNGQTKPDVAAVGWDAVVADQVTGQPSYNNGTSFACPIMAGLTTCLWQAFPEVKNMDIIDALHQASDKATDPDNRTGYGIPDMKKAFVELIKKLFIQQTHINSCKVTLNWEVKSDSEMNFVIERRSSADTGFVAIDTQSIRSGFAANNFTYTDDMTSLPAGNFLYRIKMNIAADTSFYLDTAAVFYDGACSILTDQVSINPNPASGNISILIVQNKNVAVSVVLYNSNGQKVYSLNNQQLAGSDIYTIPMNQFSNGIYYATVFINNKKEITKEILH